MHFKTNVLFFVLFLVSCSVNITFSQTTVDPDSALQKILDSLEGTRLSLSQAQDYALNNSTSVRRSEAVYLAALGSLRRERGFFDPEFYFNLYHQEMNEPSSSFFAGADVLVTEQTTSQTGITWNSPIGTRLELSLNTISLNTNSQFAFLNPQYNSFGSLALRQPLLGGFAASARKNLNRFEFEFDAAEARYQQELIAVKTVVEQNYWRLYTSERDYAVQKLSAERAEAFLKETELRSTAGIVGPSQVASAKTFLAEQQLILIDAEEILYSQSDILAALIGARPEEGNVKFKTINNPPSNFLITPVEEIIEYAVNKNLELKASQKEIEAVNSMAAAAGWEYLPQLDLVGSLTSSGLGGTSQPVIFGSDTLLTTSGGSFGDVLNQAFNRKYPGWTVGVELSLPIGLRPGLGEKDRLEAEVLNFEQRYTELLRILEQQIRTAHRELVNGKARLKAAADGVEAAEEQARIGMIEFENDRITAFELVRLAEDFAIAQRRYSEALVKTVNAAAALRQLTSGKYPVSEN